MHRSLLLLALGFTTAAHAQHTIEAFPNPYDEAVADTLVLRNVGTEPVTLDSLRFASSLDWDATFWGAGYIAYLDGEEHRGFMDCPGDPFFPCHDYDGHLVGASLAPTDPIAIYGLVAYCGICRGGGWTVDDTLLIYAGGAPEPLVVEILNGIVSVSTEGVAPVASHAVDVYPNPAQHRATVRVNVPAASEIEVRTYDGLGRLVAGPERRTVGAGEHAVPLSLAGLAAGVYHVEVRATGPAGEWRSQRVVVVLE